MIEIDTLTIYDALAVSNRMRDLDRAGIEAILGPCDPHDFAINRFQSLGAAWAVRLDGEPIAMGGVEFVNAWTGVLWIAATEDMQRQSWRKLIRHARTVMRNALNEANTHHRHRIEAHVVSGWHQATEFAQRMGLTYEGTRRWAGSQGEDIQIWAAVAA